MRTRRGKLGAERLRKSGSDFLHRRYEAAYAFLRTDRFAEHHHVHAAEQPVLKRDGNAKRPDCAAEDTAAVTVVHHRETGFADRAQRLRELVGIARQIVPGLGTEGKPRGNALLLGGLAEGEIGASPSRCRGRESENPAGG